MKPLKFNSDFEKQYFLKLMALYALVSFGTSLLLNWQINSVVTSIFSSYILYKYYKVSRSLVDTLKLLLLMVLIDIVVLLLVILIAMFLQALGVLLKIALCSLIVFAIILIVKNIKDNK